MAARRRLLLIVAALAVTAGTATACTEANGTNGKNYVPGDGAVIEIDPSDRGEPVELSGETLTGDQVDLADRRGSVVVVNVWWAGCPPCRKEAPLLVGAPTSSATAHVVGVDVREDAATARPSSAVRHHLTLVLLPGGEALLAFPAR
jgi:hypothetical protein